MILSLLTAIVFLGCNNPFDQPQQVKSPEAGKGYFLLTIGASRTIMPTDAMDEFAGGFRLEFFAAGEGPTGTPAKTVEWDSGILSGPVLLDAGNYDLQVSAFADEEKTIVTAQGELEGIVINTETPAKGTVTLVPVEGGPLTKGEGSFRWNIGYTDADVSAAMMTVTPLSENGTVEKTWYFKGGTPGNSKNKNDSLTLNSGYYRVLVMLTNNGGLVAERRETLHVYQNMESVYEFTFDTGHFVDSYILVTNENDDGEGSLRKAIADVPSGGRIVVSPDVKTIVLETTLEITKSMTINGNGVTITPSGSWVVDSRSSLMYISNAAAELVTVNRIWFKDGRGGLYGGGISKGYYAGTLNVESCIFTGNQVNDIISSQESGGGAIYSYNGTLNVTGCTFYDNSATRGSTILYDGCTTTYTGNVFYQNGGSGINYVIVPGLTPKPATDGGYNVISYKQSSTPTLTPISPKQNFRPFLEGGAAHIIETLPEDYPAEDFYGYPITDGASAGAVQSVCESIILVTIFTDESGSENREGTLRYALANAEGGDKIRIEQSGQTISLSSRLPDIKESITIEGNGVTLTPAPSMTAGNASQLMYINGGLTTISRVWFKDGRATSSGAAIYINRGTLNLESCIFSGNQASGTNAYGGAICVGDGSSFAGDLNVKSSTFYNNSAYRGGAIYKAYSTLNFTGNLFYGNTAGSLSGHVIYLERNGPFSSYGYNVSDGVLALLQSGNYTPNADDKIISSEFLPVSAYSFRLLPESAASGVITTLPKDYPAKDFYGNAIPATGAAAGAVQGTTANGYYLDLSVNENARGSVSANPARDADGCYSGSTVVDITATAEAGYEFSYWLVNGIKSGNANPLSIPFTELTFVQAVFGREVPVTNPSDASGSATVVGTLRHAMTTAGDGDIIRIRSSGQTIELSSRLPVITKNMTIEGNGVTITRAPSMTESDTSQLMYINSADANVTINRVWFKDGRAATAGAAIRIVAGTVTLESCIFSGNQISESSSYGGAIYKLGTGTLNVKGCTFYNNSASVSSGGYGGAIYSDNGTLILSGNLFYGNTAYSGRGPVVFRDGGTVTSNGYNVVNVALGASGTQSGFANSTGNDTTIAALLGNNTTTPFADGDTLAPKSELNIIPSSFAGNMPAVDFYGVARTWTGAPGAVR